MLALKISRLPSRENVFGVCASAPSVKRSVPPVPSAAWTKSGFGLTREDVNTIRRPSRVQTGAISLLGSVVSRVSVSRAKSQIQMSSCWCRNASSSNCRVARERAQLLITIWTTF